MRRGLLAGVGHVAREGLDLGVGLGELTVAASDVLLERGDPHAGLVQASPQLIDLLASRRGARQGRSKLDGQLLGAGGLLRDRGGVLGLAGCGRGLGALRLVTHRLLGLLGGVQFVAQRVGLGAGAG